MTDFRLLETMRVLEGGEVYLLERHLDRVCGSAKFFSFKCEPQELRRAILRAVPRNGKPAWLRLVLAEDGACGFQSGPLEIIRPQRLKLSRLRVDSKDPFLRHKTTNRQIYEEARRECDEHTDAILVNERGEITETTVTNIAVRKDGRWITPAVSCGLLPGVSRAELLARGEIVEGVVYCDELIAGEPIRCFNALRGIFEARFNAG